VAPPAGGSGIAIVDKIRDYRGRAAEATATLLRLQNWLHDANISVMRFKGLYEWRNVRATHAFFLLSLAATLVLLLVPQRIVFLAFLAWLFTIRWRTSPSPIELLLVQVPLPKSFISRIERVKKE
jgi:Tfp pilus assembly protein PilN